MQPHVVGDISFQYQLGFLQRDKSLKLYLILSGLCQVAVSYFPIQFPSPAFPPNLSAPILGYVGKCCTKFRLCLTTLILSLVHVWPNVTLLKGHNPY